MRTDLRWSSDSIYDRGHGHCILCLVALDCPDPRSLAIFCRGIVGGEVKETATDEWVRLEISGGADIGFQQDLTYQPPEWPNGTPQQAHLDFDVSDLDAGERAVLWGDKTVTQ